MLLGMSTKLVSLTTVIVLIGIGNARTMHDTPDCYVLLYDLTVALNQAYEVTSTVEITTGGYEIAYNRSRFSRQGDKIDVTLLEQRGRRTNYDQDVVLSSDAASNPAYVSEQVAVDNSANSHDADTDSPLLPFDCLEYNLEAVSSTSMSSTSISNMSSASVEHSHEQDVATGIRYVLKLANTTEIPVDTWQLTFQQQDNWYVLEQLSAKFEIEILFIPVRGSFHVSFETWDLPARLPVSPRERLTRTSP